jgi:GT2 family glycosyltransferase
MSLISIASWVTQTNNRLWMLKETLQSLAKTVDFNRHRLFVIDNGSTEETLRYYEEAGSILPFTLIKLPENIGTARAINKAWLYRNPGEHALKMDSDIVIEESGWLDKLEECVQRDEKIGIIGLKRMDCIEAPWTEGWYHSDLHMLPQVPGTRWLVVEKASHIIGACQLYNSKLLDKIGFLYQQGALYGLDDSIAAARCSASGFYSCFYPHYTIHHIDPGDTDYQKWKEQYAAK